MDGWKDGWIDGKAKGENEQYFTLLKQMLWLATMLQMANKQSVIGNQLLKFVIYVQSDLCF